MPAIFVALCSSSSSFLFNVLGAFSIPILIFLLFLLLGIYGKSGYFLFGFSSRDSATYLLYVVHVNAPSLLMLISSLFSFGLWFIWFVHRLFLLRHLVFFLFFGVSRIRIGNGTEGTILVTQAFCSFVVLYTTVLCLMGCGVVYRIVSYRTAFI